MTTLAERKKIAEWVLNTKDDLLLDKIKELALSKSKAINDFISDYNREIDDAVERVKKGNYKTQEEVEALLDLWESN
jgi:gas vesicle protein